MNFKNKFDWTKVDKETMEFIKEKAPEFLKVLRSSFKEPVDLNGDFFLGLMYAIYSFRIYTMLGPMESKEVDLFGMTFVYIKEMLLGLDISEDEFKEIEGFDFIKDDPLNGKRETDG